MSTSSGKLANVFSSGDDDLFESIGVVGTRSGELLLSKDAERSVHTAELAHVGDWEGAEAGEHVTDRSEHLVDSSMMEGQVVAIEVAQEMLQPELLFLQQPELMTTG
jgi:hypothetical protein